MSGTLGTAPKETELVEEKLFQSMGMDRNWTAGVNLVFHITVE